MVFSLGVYTFQSILTSFINQFDAMRSYGKNRSFMFKKSASYKQRTVRYATEWDIRVDITEELTPEVIVKNLKSIDNDWSYCLVSGVEFADTLRNKDGPINQHGSKDNHVHVCLVLHVPCQRGDALKMVRGLRKLSDEYAAPRNSKFSYAGWVIHHSKPGFKLSGQPDTVYESGDLPMDPFTTEWAVKIESMLKRWGSPRTFSRFKAYTDILKKHKIMEKIELLQMSLEDDDVSE